MKKGFSKAITRFINEHNNAKTLNLIWYGGEPLLSFNRIKEIYNNIKSDTNVQITNHSIVTNGYLIKTI